MFELLIAAAIVLPLIGYLFYLTKKSADEAAEAFGERVGFQVKHTGMFRSGASGRYRGLPIRVQIAWGDRGGWSPDDLRNEYTLYSTAVPGDLPRGLYVAEEAFIATGQKLLGMQDIQLGLPGIDKHLLVRGDDEDEVIRWANQPGVARALADMAAFKASKRPLIENGRVSIRTYPLMVPESVGYHIHVLEQLATIALALGGADYEPVDEAIARVGAATIAKARTSLLWVVAAILVTFALAALALTAEPPTSTAARDAWIERCAESSARSDCEAASDQHHERCFRKSGGDGWLDMLPAAIRPGSGRARLRPEFSDETYGKCVAEQL